MSEPKTKPTNQNPTDFLNTIEPEEKRRDCLTLLEIFQHITGEKPVMYGPSIVGFGTYRSNTGIWPLIAFSPRKQSLTLYIMEGNKDNQPLLDTLGKHKVSGICLHINRLSDIDQRVLANLIESSFRYNKNTLNE